MSTAPLLALHRHDLVTFSPTRFLFRIENAHQADNEIEAAPHSVESESLLTQKVNDAKPAGSVWRRLAAVAVLLALGVLGYSASSEYSSSEQLYVDSSPMDMGTKRTAQSAISPAQAPT